MTCSNKETIAYMWYSYIWFIYPYKTRERLKMAIAITGANVHFWHFISRRNLQWKLMVMYSFPMLSQNFKFIRNTKCNGLTAHIHYNFLTKSPHGLSFSPTNCTNFIPWYNKQNWQHVVCFAQLLVRRNEDCSPRGLSPPPHLSPARLSPLPHSNCQMFIHA